MQLVIINLYFRIKLAFFLFVTHFDSWTTLNVLIKFTMSKEEWVGSQTE